VRTYCQKDRKIDRQKDNKTYCQKNRKIDRQKDNKTYCQKDRKIDTHQDRQKDILSIRQKYRPRERQTVK